MIDKIYNLFYGDEKMKNLFVKGTSKQVYFNFYYYLSFYFSFGYLFCLKNNMVPSLSEFNRKALYLQGV